MSKNVYKTLERKYVSEMKQCIDGSLSTMNRSGRNPDQYIISNVLMRHMFPFNKRVTGNRKQTLCYYTKIVKDIKLFTDLLDTDVQFLFYMKVFSLSGCAIKIMNEIIKASNENMSKQMQGIISMFIINFDCMIDKIVTTLNFIQTIPIQNKMKCFNDDTINKHYMYYSKNKRVYNEVYTNCIYSSTEIINKTINESVDFFYRFIPVVNSFLFESFNTLKYFDIDKNEKLKEIDDVLGKSKSLSETLSYFYT